MTTKDHFDSALSVARPTAHVEAHMRGDHGIEHWRRVRRNGAFLASETPGADVQVIEVFAALHDTQRLNEWRDVGHGPRASAHASELHARGLLGLTDAQFKVLRVALRDHNGSNGSSDPTVGCCFDADRLDLPRVGVTPDPRRMSTAAGKALAAEMRTAR